MFTANERGGGGAPAHFPVPVDATLLSLSISEDTNRRYFKSFETTAIWCLGPGDVASLPDAQLKVLSNKTTT